MQQVDRFGRPTIQCLDRQNISGDQSGQFVANRGRLTAAIVMHHIFDPSSGSGKRKGNRKRLFAGKILRQRPDQ